MKHPAQPPGKPVEEKLLGPIIKAYLAASKEVWNDPAAWIEERASNDMRLLAWPRPEQPTGYQDLLALMFNADVESVLKVLELRGHPALPGLPPDVSDPKFQVVLRVMHRAFLHGMAAIQPLADLAGADRVTGLREFRNQTNEAGADLIKRAGLDRELGDGVYKALTTSRSSAYRAMKRRRAR